jgi:eukaryotic-like serine/threonine-protein kinase
MKQPHEPNNPENLLVDMQARWFRGERPTIQDYLRELPELAQSKEAMLDLLYCEVELREKHGVELVPEYYIEVLPHLESEIRKLFEVHAAFLSSEFHNNHSHGNQSGDENCSNGNSKSSPGQSRLRNPIIQRELLLGVMAIQLEYLSQAQLREALITWKAQPRLSLRQILLQKQWVTAHALTEIEQYLERLLSRYKGDLNRALADKADGELRNLIRDIEDQRTSHTVNLLPPSQQFVHLGLVETIDLSSKEKRSKYSLSSIKGKGGLGQVWLAQDTVLRRAVALKEPRHKVEMNDRAWQQFIMEARITGQLEHPNIIPIYELFEEPSAREVFYTMRYLDGQTLAGAIKAFHERNDEITKDTITLRSLLTAFVSICNAIAYAHSRGVIHRDLKPSNVMLGGFGEVLVLDWGLAKVIGNADSNAKIVRLPQSSDHEDTQAGHVKGTLFYMAPEQAQGRVDLVDSRTDIYGLGSILYAILTGQEPHRGDANSEGTQDVIQRIVDLPTPLARTKKQSIPLPLNAVCAKAMEKERSERYRTALELAKDVERWLADEEVSVYCDPWSVRLIRWTRRNRTWAISLAGSLLMVTCVAVIAMVMIQRALNRETIALSKANNALISESQAREQEASAKLEATRRFQQSQQTVDTMLTGVDELLRYYPGAKSLRTRLLTEAARAYEEFSHARSDDLELSLEAARAKVRVGDVHSMLGEFKSACTTYQEAMELMQQLQKGPLKEQAMYEHSVCLEKYGMAHAELNARESAQNAYKQAVAILEALPSSDLVKLAQANAYFLQAQLISHTHPKQAVELLGKAESMLVDLDQHITEPTQQRKLVSQLTLIRALWGQTLSETGDTEHAVVKLEQTADTFRELTQLEPAHPPHLEGLAFSEMNLANSMRTLGIDTKQSRLLDSVIANYALLNQALPDAPRMKENLAVALTNRAWLHQQRGENEEARSSLDKAINILSELYQSPNRIPRYLEELTASAVVLGRALTELGEWEAAESNLTNAITAYENILLRENPNSAYYLRGLGTARRHLGRLRLAQARTADAEQEFSKAVTSFREALTETEEPFARDELAFALEHSGDLAVTLKQPKEASRYYASAKAERAKLPFDPEYRSRMIALLAKMPAEDRVGLVGTAEAFIKENPNVERYLQLLATVYFEAGDFEQAIQSLQRINSMNAERNNPYQFLWAIALTSRNQPDDREKAEAAFQRGCKIMEQAAPQNLELLHWQQRAKTVLAPNSIEASINP